MATTNDTRPWLKRYDRRWSHTYRAADPKPFAVALTRSMGHTIGLSVQVYGRVWTVGWARTVRA